MLFQSKGVNTKAQDSRDRTNRLYEEASAVRDIVNNELQPRMETAMVDVDGVREKNKHTKDYVEIISRKLDAMPDLTEKLKETVINATDAETVAHDALASIDARAEVIKNDMKTARGLMDDDAEIQFAIGKNS